MCSFVVVAIVTINITLLEPCRKNRQRSPAPKLSMRGAAVACVAFCWLSECARSMSHLPLAKRPWSVYNVFLSRSWENQEESPSPHSSQHDRWDAYLVRLLRIYRWRRRGGGGGDMFWSSSWWHNNTDRRVLISPFYDRKDQKDPRVMRKASFWLLPTTLSEEST